MEGQEEKPVVAVVAKASFAPDEDAVNKLLQGIDSWSFDIFQIEDDDLPKLVEKIFRDLGVFEHFPLDLKKFRALMRSMVARYQPNPYHNFRHACDVLHAVYLLLTLTEGAQRLNELEIFALALAALCHDVDHPGLTNAFLVAASDPIALRYNDKAVLESHHAATTFLTMRGQETVNMIGSLDEAHQRHFRKLVVSCILATDMGLHAEILGHFTTRLGDSHPFEPSVPYVPPGAKPHEKDGSIISPKSAQLAESTPGAESETGSTTILTLDPTQDGVVPPARASLLGETRDGSMLLSSSNDVILFMQMIIKCADLSNVVKPFFLSKRWSALLVLEWFRQGDIERELGMHISKFMDREDPTTLMAMTCGCIDFVAKPMYEAMAALLPHMHDEVFANVTLNRSLWNAFSTNGRRASEIDMQEQLLRSIGVAWSFWRSHWMIGISAGSPTGKMLFQGVLMFKVIAVGLLSQTAETILGPFCPPPVSVDKAPETFIEAPVTLEGRLVATPSGEYIPSDKSLQRPSDRTTLWPIERAVLAPESPSQKRASKIINLDQNVQTLITKAANLAVKRKSSNSALAVKANRHHSTAVQNTEFPLSLLFGQTMTDDRENNIVSGRGFGRTRSFRVSIQQTAKVNGTKQKPHVILNNFFQPVAQPGQKVIGGQLSAIHSKKSSKLVGDVSRLASLHSQHWQTLGFWGALRSYPQALQINQFLDSKLWVTANILASFVAIFADDFMKAILPKQADVYEIHVLLTCMAFFTIELIILSVLRPGYFIGMFFWLDLVGTISLVAIVTNIYGQNLVIARTGRAANTVTRASKLLQASHFSSLFPVAYVVKIFRRRKWTINNTSDEELAEVAEHSSVKPSQIWTKLSELTTHKIIIGLLLIIVLTPYTQVANTDLGPVMSLDSLDGDSVCSAQFNVSLGKVLNFNSQHNYNLLYLAVMGGCINGSDDGGTTYNQIIPTANNGFNVKQSVLEQYRTGELLSITSDSNRSEALYSILKRTRLKYGLNVRGPIHGKVYNTDYLIDGVALKQMVSTVIMLVILAALSFFLSRDSNRLLIQPIERMVEFVKELADDPVSFAGKALSKPLHPIDQGNETKMVEAALVKIASLTKVALGNAGMDILSVNLKGAEFNPMVPGKKIQACFGFCDIRNFTDATECLQEDVMMFVNKIADVVHNKVVLHQGFPNKNIGDAFLIVWKKTVADNTNKTRGTSFADRALQSFLDIILCIETSQSLAEFAMHPAIQKRMPGYKIRMGFGLHVGWAIEGAIGSSHKVDPSYLSPHVNMASRLEAATKQYGVMILISGTVIANLTKSSLRDNCRKLDCVTVKGSAEPLVLYTFDMPMFQQDLKGHPSDYRDRFECAVDNYIEGAWGSSLEKLEECLQLWPTDKPGEVLLNFMASHNYRVPLNWQGYRELTEK